MCCKMCVVCSFVCAARSAWCMVLCVLRDVCGVLFCVDNAGIANTNPTSHHASSPNGVLTIQIRSDVFCSGATIPRLFKADPLILSLTPTWNTLKLCTRRSASIATSHNLFPTKPSNTPWTRRSRGTRATSGARTGDLHLDGKLHDDSPQEGLSRKQGIHRVPTGLALRETSTRTTGRNPTMSICMFGRCRYRTPTAGFLESASRRTGTRSPRCGARAVKCPIIFVGSAAECTGRKKKKDPPSIICGEDTNEYNGTHKGVLYPSAP